MTRKEALPSQVTAGDLRAASARVGELQGWDFSRVRALRGESPWDYEEVVAGFSTPATRLLDIGTGGGEILERLLPLVGSAVAIDMQPSMVETARRHLGTNVPVLVADGFALPFADDTFGLVANRHAQVYIPECARVLEPGGVLVAQKVGDRNFQSVFDAFGWGSNGQMWANTDRPPSPVQELAAEAAGEGLEVIRAEEYEVEFVFRDLDSLVFTLKAAPFPEIFDPDSHCAGVNRLLDERSASGIETTEHREILVARKHRQRSL